MFKNLHDYIWPTRIILLSPIARYLTSFTSSEFLLAYQATYSQVPEIRIWTYGRS